MVTTISYLNARHHQRYELHVRATCAPRERRASAEQVHFRGTKYEARVDVGQCVGKCRVHGES